MKTTAPAANGATKTPELSSAVVVADKPNSTEAKKEQNETKDAPPLEDRILKVEMLYDLTTRRETLLESQKKLNSFRLSSDGTRDTISLRDSKGNEFTTSNSAVVHSVFDVMKKTIAEKIAEVEAQILF
jgi:hypothetical protein